MNPLCPNTNKLCFACEEPCDPLEILDPREILAPKDELEQIAALFGELTENVSIATNFDDELAVTVTLPL